MDDMKEFEYLRHFAGAYTPLERADKEYKEQAAAYFKEQRELIADQKKYTFWTKWATIVMASATLVMAVFMALQYLAPLTSSQRTQEADSAVRQGPELQQSQAPHETK
jgi:hypothetical protein